MTDETAQRKLYVKVASYWGKVHAPGILSTWVSKFCLILSHCLHCCSCHCTECYDHTPKSHSPDHLLVATLHKTWNHLAVQNLLFSCRFRCTTLLLQSDSCSIQPDIHWPPSPHTLQLLHLSHYHCGWRNNMYIWGRYVDWLDS